MARKSARRRLLEEFASACGEDIVALVDAGNGWPGRVNVQMPSGVQPLDVYVANISPHSRRDYEYRFQNPAEVDQRPIRPTAGIETLLCGFTVWNGEPVVVAADSARRFHSDRRASILFHVHVLDSASILGWAEYNSKSGEQIYAFAPRLLPSYLQIQSLSVHVPEISVARAIEISGFRPGGPLEAVERAREGVSRLVRDARFRERIAGAYSGRCALSGINWSMVEAAHIYPLSAPDSNDSVRNGVALAPTYHALFDRHLVYVDPKSFRVVLHPKLHTDATEAGARFLEATFRKLHLPATTDARPDPQMFEKRYEWFGEAYAWAI